MLLLTFLLSSSALVGFTPLQAGGGFEWQWWYGLVLVTCLLLPLLIFVLSLAFRDAPDAALLQSQMQAEEAALATARAASRAAATAPAAEAASPAAADADLKKIEGIGPKIAELLNNSGIHSFADLADADESSLRQILDAAGSRFQMADPSSWPEQARLAAAGQWEALQTLQDQLQAGRRSNA
jgi:predicted flap endonuclease-1-like 5' DNA nuclease